MKQLQIEKHINGGKIIFFFLLLVVGNSFSQTFDRNIIMRDSIIQLMRNQEINFNKISDSIKIFDGDETFILALLKNDYQYIIDNEKWFWELRYNANFPTYSMDDSVIYYLLKYLEEDTQTIVRSINNSNYKNEQKSLLLLTTYFYALHSNNCDTTMQKYFFEACKNYLLWTHNTNYQRIISKKYLFSHNISNWGVLTNFYSGLQYFSNDYLKKMSLNSELEFGIIYKKIFFNFSLNWSYSNEIQKDFFYNVNWKNNQKYYLGIYNFNIGYSFVFLRINFIPYIGYIPYETIFGKDKTDTLYFTNANIVRKNIVSFGFMLKYNLKKETTHYYTGCRIKKYEYPISLKFQFQNPGFHKIVPELRGEIFSINLGIGINYYFNRKIKK